MTRAPGIELLWRGFAVWLVFPGLSAALLLTSAAGAPQANATAGQGSAVARSEAVEGALLQRGAGQAWQSVKAGDALAPETLLVALPKAEIVSKNGAVKLAMLADVGQRTPLPVLESAVTLHANDAADLDFTFDRGLIGLKNLKKAGAAKVRIRLPGATWELTLQEPDSTAVLEIYGRHPPGAPQVVKGKVEPPASEVYLLMLKGQGFLDAGPKGYRITAPPGPAVVHWDTVGNELEVRRLEKLPEGVRPLDEKESKVFQEICRCASSLAGGKDIGAALDALLKSDTKADRLVGVTAAGAIDDLPRVLHALADPKHADLRDHTVLVLRSWVGRGPGQVEKLHDALRAAKYSEVQARTIIRLLFGFSAEERRDAATYDLLINYLKHSKLPVRELARWHLFRLTPLGREIPYDAAAPAAERQRAYDAWRARVPEGKLPPAPRAKPAPK
jgi:hypothetical protein